ncbi:DUF1127 domain-containing protein [Ahrensia sp. 13_GOM-1096m]|uniref:DUF1127 domain-containing protein n=1 Tax=Ahrensia sp. 13_GOM-1096m TaxID=1380380 RepID=UPI0009DD462A|nr:DUF1127 domain-containing protein [Ahrensia sp. 13_GOM-1096m]
MSIARSFNTWRTAQRTANQLRRLSNRELADVGIQREAIYEIALKSARNNTI